MKTKSLSILSAMGLSFAFASAASATAPEWNLERAIVAGQGCNLDNTSVLGEGNSLYVVFYDLELAAGGDGPSAGRSACTIRLPVKLPAGTYLRGARVSLGGDFDKAADATAAMALRAGVGGLAGSVTIPLPDGEFVRRDYTFVRDVVIENGAETCGRPEREEMFAANLAITARGTAEAPVSIDIGRSHAGFLRVKLDLADCKQ